MESGWYDTVEIPRDIRHSNEIADLEYIHTEIHSHESAISVIDQEIDELMRTVRQLQFKKWEHTEGIRRCKGLITLARRLPYEILANIFELCVRDGFTRTPLVVSHVCSRWRKAASIPSVWSHVYVDFDGRDPRARTRFWLERAGNSYLRITLELPMEVSQLSEVIGLLLEKRTQWRSLVVNSILLANINRTLAICAGPFPELHSLHVSVQQEFGGGADQQASDGVQELVGLRTAFLAAPHFSTVHITRNILPSPNTLPLSVTKLFLHLRSYHSSFNLSLLSVIRVLEALPNLEVFSLALSPGQARHFEPVEDTEYRSSLPHLCSLTLTGWPDINNLLPHLLIPNLKALHLRSSDDLIGMPFEETGSCLLQFLEQAAPPLEELELRDTDIPAPYLIQCLEHMEHLKTLRMHDSEISDHVLRELFGPYGICPSLSILDLRWCGHFRGRTLVDLVRSRTRPPIHVTPFQGVSAAQPVCAPMTKVIVINCSFVQKRDIEDLALMTVCQVVVLDIDDHCRKYSCL